MEGVQPSSRFLARVRIAVEDVDKVSSENTRIMTEMEGCLRGSSAVVMQVERRHSMAGGASVQRAWPKV